MKPGSFTSFLTLWQREEYLSAKKRGQKPKKERRMCKLIKLLIVSGNHLWHCISPSRGAIRATCYDLSQFHGWWRLFHCWRAHSYSTTYCIIRADRSLVIFFSSFFFLSGWAWGKGQAHFDIKLVPITYDKSLLIGSWIDLGTLPSFPAWACWEAIKSNTALVLTQLWEFNLCSFQIALSLEYKW